MDLNNPRKYTFLERELKEVMDGIWGNRLFITKQDLEILRNFQNKCFGIEVYRRKQCDLVSDKDLYKEAMDSVSPADFKRMDLKLRQIPVEEKAWIKPVGKVSYAVFKHGTTYMFGKGMVPVTKRVGTYRSYAKAEQIRKSIQNG